jgi:hypothetical protein
VPTFVSDVNPSQVLMRVTASGGALNLQCVPLTPEPEGSAGAVNYALDVGINDFNNSKAIPYTTAIAARA